MLKIIIIVNYYFILESSDMAVRNYWIETKKSHISYSLCFTMDCSILPKKILYVLKVQRLLVLKRT